MKNQYLNLRINAARRLAILKQDFTNAHAKYAGHRSQTWRDMRYGTFKEAYTGLNASFTKDGQSWYSNGGAQFEREVYCDEVEGIRIDHEGWFCDSDGCDKARGVIVRLPHGRFIAGYALSCNDERVYFATLYDDEREAARAADSEAESVADSEREYQDKYREASDLSDETETALQRLRECLALRNNPCFEALRDEARDLIEAIKGNRERLSGEFAGML